MNACLSCGHEHQGRELGFICIGCPCMMDAQGFEYVPPTGTPSKLPMPANAPEPVAAFGYSIALAPTVRPSEFRKDGWPICPRCGNDELYSLAVPATRESICGCYVCGPLVVELPADAPPPALIVKMDGAW